MSNLFNTINIGLKGLQAQKKSLDTTSHNISNANTEGYSRQRAVHSTTDPYTVPGVGMPEGAGQVGTGVEIEEINRIKDQFLEGQIWEKKQSQSYWNKRSDGISRIENILNEPSDNNLSAAFDRFWQSLQDLNNNPEDSAVRSTVKERANTLVDAFHSIDEQLTAYKRSLNGDVQTTVNEINSLGKRIADLNEQITHIKGSGKNPNDLMDTRDKLIEELNQKVNVRTREDDRGNINITIGGMGFVTGDESNDLTVEDNPDSDYKNEDIIKFEELDEKANIKSGELAALMDLRGRDGKGIIAEQKNELDSIAKTFANEFNEVHKAGFDLNKDPGEKFFVSDSGDISADSINLSSVIDNDIKKIAAGAPEFEAEVNATIDSDDVSGVNKTFTVEGNDLVNSSGTVVASTSDNGLTWKGNGEGVLDSNLEFSFNQKVDSGEIKIDDSAADKITGTATFTANNLELGSSYEIDSSSGELYKGSISTGTVIANHTGDGVFKNAENEDVLRLDNPANADLNLEVGDKEVGNGANALNLSDVIKSDDLDFNNDGKKESTVMGKYESVISSLGVQGQRANQMVENQDTLVNQLENKRQSISGVSIDEEMANMIKYQQAYSASAKVISNANRMMDSLMAILR